MKQTILSTFILITILSLVPDAAHADEKLGRKRIGVVLEGGGAKGFAHVGVLKVLEREHVPVDLIVGTSMGSIVGAAYASGRTIEEMEEVLSSTDWDSLFDEAARRRSVTYHSKAGRDRELYGDTKIGLKDGSIVLPTALVQGQNVEPVLQRLFGKVPPSISFDELPIPYRAVAADIETGEAVVLSKGNLALAARASMSVPTFFAPVEIDGRLLVDGGITDNLPVALARSLGAEIIIAVECKDHLKKRDNLGDALAITGQILDLLLEKNTQASLKLLGPDDIHLPVEMGGYGSSSFAAAKEIMALGEKSADENRGRLQKLAVSEQQFAAFYERRVGGEPYRPLVHYVDVTGVDDAEAEELQRLFKSQVGKPFDVEAVQKTVYDIHQSGQFKKVTYEFAEKDGATGLLVKAAPKEWLSNYARLGFALEDNFDGQSNYSLALQTRFNHLNDFGAYLDLQFEAGRSPRAYAELYQPVAKGSPVFLAPEISWGRQELLLRSEDEIIAEFQRDQLVFAMKGGYSLGRFGELSTGWRYGEGKLSRQIGDPELENRDYDIGEVFERVVLDQLDNPDFPTEGYRFLVLGTQARDSLGAEGDYEKVEGVATLPLTLGANTLLLNGEVGGSSDDLPVERYSSFGGFLDVSGFEQGSLIASDYWIARAAYYRRIAEGGSALFPFGGYLGGTFEFASLRSELEQIGDRPELVAGSVFVGADTPILPIYFGFGLAEEGETSAYMNIGRIAGRRR